MKKRLIGAIIILFVGWSTFAQDNDSYQDELLELEPKSEHEKALFVTLNLLKQYHYRKLNLDDSISSVVFDNYLNSLDPSKAFFLKSDIEYFEKYRDKIDDELVNSHQVKVYNEYMVHKDRVDDNSLVNNN